MPWVEALSDPPALRRCIRDLVAISTLPAIWKDYDPNQIADSVAAALVAMTGADFVYVLIPDRRGEPSIEILRAGGATAGKSLELIRAALRKELPARTARRQFTIANPDGEGICGWLALRKASATTRSSSLALAIRTFPTKHTCCCSRSRQTKPPSRRNDGG